MSSVFSKDTPNGMVLIPEGTFMMGTEKGADFELPVHSVTISTFFIDRFEVSNSKYEVFDPKHRRSIRSFCDLCPVTLVTWEEAESYCKYQKKRLPTEAEWERSSLGLVKKNNRMFPADSDRVWYQQNFNAGSLLVNALKPNDFGLHNMRGNVWEWVYDWFDFYLKGELTDPSGPPNGIRKIVRGGSWYSKEYYVNPKMRFRLYPKTKLNSLGFRCAVDDH